MPSPFPGMDPYLESPDWFPGLHDSLIVYLQEALQPKLPEPYYAQISQRVWVEGAGRHVEPDLDVLRLGHAPRQEGGGAAVAVEAISEPVIVTVEPEPEIEVVEPFLEVRARRGDEIEVVTSIEVLSLANKTPGSKGRALYRKKQEEVLAGGANLVEVDLLRGGHHATAVPRALAVARAGAFDYHASVHQVDRPNDYFVYPIRLERRLPSLAIPLRPGEPGVALDLQAAFNRAYDAGPYRRAVRYGQHPIIPPLGPERAEWLAATLRAAGAV